ncbi:hypothetical protein EDC96DRAFT_521363 [Choanephora cucurbitarum]|nr:hypothetical protein EDC96DRAFT_521363 [Choanephora cucurbitarum]
MLFSRSLLAISCLLFSVANAAPTQSAFAADSLTETKATMDSKHTPEAGFLLVESLSEYYENIVDQVMLDVSEDILSFVPQSISHGEVEVRQLAQKSLNRNLNFMRASLLASVNPLVSTDIPQINGLTEIQQEAIVSMTSEEQISHEDNQQELEATLLSSIMTLNKKISHQLGLIVNAKQSSSILIRQANTRTLTKSKTGPTVVTIEWKLRRPFQINVHREEKTETIEQQYDVTSESEWLHHQLSAIEVNLLNEFDDRAQEAVQLVMESLALDI